jgi:hypothetical protein
MIAITTRSSTSVNPRRRRDGRLLSRTLREVDGMAELPLELA